jgi:hypothetical protein
MTRSPYLQVTTAGRRQQRVAATISPTVNMAQPC